MVDEKRIDYISFVMQRVDNFRPHSLTLILLMQSIG
jgi:hypothetical protein